MVIYRLDRACCTRCKLRKYPKLKTFIARRLPNPLSLQVKARVRNMKPRMNAVVGFLGYEALESATNLLREER